VTDVTGRTGATRLAVIGASGRMGQTVVRLAPAHGFEVVCEVSEGDTLAKLVASDDRRAEVLIDFSTPSLTRAVAEAAAWAGIAMVCGTTGLDDDARAALDAASAKVPVVWEPNMSVGVHVLTEVVRRAVAMLGRAGAAWDIEIVEAHHRLKVDAPSGTALRLAEAAREARAPAESVLVHGREGKPGARGGHEIGMHALRGGDVIGDHTVHLLGPGERIELTHRASSRDLFADGALRVARFCARRGPGRYTIADMLG
jgi:4-hydroxy-tetrahydrodipicolinate reductase